MRFVPRRQFFPVQPPPTDGTHPSCFAFAFAKGGSTLLYDILTLLAPHAGVTYFSVSNHLYGKNVRADRRPSHIGSVLKPTGYCYGGYRDFPFYAIPMLHEAQVVFLVRDPRDMLTSLYYSVALSHGLPGEPEPGSATEALLRARERALGQTPDEFCLANVHRYTRMFEGYLAQFFHWRPNVATYRYEDVIYAKRDWIRDICAWYGWMVTEAAVDEVLERVDVVPTSERPEEHIRQVRPGDHARRLKPATIAALNDILGEYLLLYGYAVPGQASVTATVA
ncbi:sulfotransferase domain-containing protein [Roseomonas sp. CCTCC AB2023176]|uniref:sulfotransferase domain-containing protein n=1 Tax=Roseomonas sp. CCTCC AB2023176 TaxID=3342640 RepID=UPI0035DCEB9F